MKHSIIKDFKSWNAIFEALPALGPDEVDIYDAQGMVSQIKNTKTGEVKTINPPEKRLTADQQAAANLGVMAAKAVQAPVQITAADGALTPEDIKNVQRVLMLGGMLMKGQTKDPNKPGDDGNVGPLTAQAIKDFRTKTGITDETTEPTAKSIGPKTLAMVNQRIQNNQLIETTYMGAGTPLATNMAAALTPEEDAKITSICDAIVNLFNYSNTTPSVTTPEGWAGGSAGAKVTATAYWAPFKGTLNDDEDAAIKNGLTPWWNGVLVPMLQGLTPANPNIAIIDPDVAKQMSEEWNKFLPKYQDQVPKDGKFPEAGFVNDNSPAPAGTTYRSSFSPTGMYPNLKDMIFKKIVGGTDDDNARWSVILSTGLSKQYVVDTDF